MILRNKNTIVMLSAVALSGYLGVSSYGSPGEREDEAAWVRPERPDDVPALLLINSEVVPTISVSWTDETGETSYEADQGFGPPSGGGSLGEDLTGYVAMGGTRLETGAGHPDGAILRVGITKVSNSEPLCEGIVPGGELVIRVAGVRFNQAVTADGSTGLVHLKYSLADVEACQLPGDARNQFLLVDPQDTLGGRIDAGVNATPGALSGEPGAGSLVGTVQEDGTVALEARIPYRMLRHLQDPWKSVLPGTFFEPIHLHAEIEIIPEWSEPMLREHPAFTPGVRMRDDIPDRLQSD